MGNQQSGAGERGGGKKGGEKGEKKKYEPPVPTRVSETVQPATYGLKILKLAGQLINISNISPGWQEAKEDKGS